MSFTVCFRFLLVVGSYGHELGKIRVICVGAIEIANDRPFVLIAGPCQIESEAHALEVAAGTRRDDAARPAFR